MKHQNLPSISILAISILLLGILLAFPAEEEPDLEFCRGRPPLFFPPLDSIAAEADIEFYSNTRDSLSTFAFRNRGEKPIIELMVLVEYFDREGRVLSMQFDAATSQARQQLRAPIRSELELPIHLPRPLLEGDRLVLTSYSPIITTRCPTEARATFVFVRYSDETTYVRSALDWQSDPIIQDAPQYFDMRNHPLFPTLDLLLRAHIDPRGRISSLTSLDQQLTPPLHWLFSQLSQWEFLPAMQNSLPIDSEVTLLVRFCQQYQEHNADWFAANPNYIPQKMVVVSIEPHRPENGEWVAYYGVIPVSRIPPTVE